MNLGIWVHLQQWRTLAVSGGALQSHKWEEQRCITTLSKWAFKNLIQRLLSQPAKTAHWCNLRFLKWSFIPKGFSNSAFIQLIKWDNTQWAYPAQRQAHNKCSIKWIISLPPPPPPHFNSGHHPGCHAHGHTWEQSCHVLTGNGEEHESWRCTCLLSPLQRHEWPEQLQMERLV